MSDINDILCFFVNIVHVSHIVLVFPLLTLKKYMLAGL